MEKPEFIAIVDLCIVYEVELEFFEAIIEHELVNVQEIDGSVQLDASEIGKFEQILRLANELKINIEGIDVILNLLARIQLLEEELTNANDKLRFLK